MAPSFVLIPSNPFVDRILIKPPNSPNPNGRNLPLSGVLADGDFMELEILGEFLCGHDLGYGFDLREWKIGY